MLHKFGDDPLAQRMQLAKLEYYTSSTAGRPSRRRTGAERSRLPLEGGAARLASR